MPAIELPPFTEAHREAVKSCRFYTPNRAHDRAWAWTDSDDIARVLCPGAGMTEAERLKSLDANQARVASATRFKRCSEPTLYEWEIAFTHPDAVAFICDLCEVRRV